MNNSLPQECKDYTATWLREVNPMIDFSTALPESAPPESAPLESITGIPSVRRIRRALRLLLDAKEYATRTQCSLWEFAVEIDLLHHLGLTDNELRFLVRSRHVEHAHDVTVIGQMDRKFHGGGTLFDQRSCFVLTVHGARLASQAIRRVRLRKSGSRPSHAGSTTPEQPMDDAQPTQVAHHSGSSLAAGKSATQQSEMHAASPLLLAGRPIWNASTRTLFWNGQIVKCFRRRAVNQEIVLGTFQEESWPLRIDDPLAPRPCQDMKRRLNDTIKCLNRGHQLRLLRFRGDGTGEGVIWEVVS